MSKRKITNPLNVQFEPFDNYGAPIPGMNWHKISYLLLMCIHLTTNPEPRSLKVFS